MAIGEMQCVAFRLKTRMAKHRHHFQINFNYKKATNIRRHTVPTIKLTFANMPRSNLDTLIDSSYGTLYLVAIVMSEFDLPVTILETFAI